MKANLLLFGIEARRSLVLWLLPFFVLIASYAAIVELPRGVWLWPHTSVAIQAALVLAGPVAAGLSAWVAARNRRRNIEELLSTTSHSATIRDLITWAATAAWLCLAYLLVAISLLLVTSLEATWSSPSVGPVLAGLFAICMHSAIGYVIGYFLPRLFTALLVTVFDYLIQGFVGFFFVSYLSPVATPIPDAFYDLSPNISVIQTLWFFGVSATVLGLVSLRLKEKNTISLFSIAITLILTLGAATILIQANPLLPTARASSSLPNYKPVCEERNVPVCMHPAYAKLLPDVSAKINKLARPLVGIPGGPVQAIQEPNQPASLNADGTLEFFLYDEESLLNDSFSVELAYALVQDERSFEDDEDLTKVQTVIAASIVQSATHSDASALFPRLNDEASLEAFDRFSQYSLEKQRNWLKENYGKVRRGQLSLRDLS